MVGLELVKIESALSLLLMLLLSYAVVVARSRSSVKRTQERD